MSVTRLWQKKPSRHLHALVALAQHIGEGGNLVFTALDFRRLFEITLGAGIANNSLAVELLFKPTEGFFHGLAFTDFNFYGHKRFG